MCWWRRFCEISVPVLPPDCTATAGTLLLATSGSVCEVATPIDATVLGAPGEREVWALGAWGFALLTVEWSAAAGVIEGEAAD